MSTIFTSQNIALFFENMQKDYSTMAEYGRAAHFSLEKIANELHIGCVKNKLTIPKSKLRENTKPDSENIFYHFPGEISEQTISCQHITGDGGIITISANPVKGYTWDHEEERCIHILCHVLFEAGSQIMTRQIIKKAVTTNLLIGIPNTTGFIDFANSLINNNFISSYDAFYFNIKNFKYVNNVLPFSQENEILKKYSELINSYLGSDECLAHLGSDNFCALVLKKNAEEFLNFISNISLEHTFEGKVYTFNFGATTGAAHLDNITDSGKIMMYINSAYIMARQHKHSIEYYSADLHKNIMSQKDIMAHFQSSIDNEEFVVLYQPKVNVSTWEICGAEALVRWNLNGRLVSPAEFIPVLEKDTSICQLDFYVLDKVCRLIRKQLDDGLTPIKISSNFSRNHIGNPKLTERIREIVDKYDIPHEYIEVELTESEDFADYAIMEKLVDDLRHLGISTSIDDFGTGYSSLNMLKRTNLDLIKIDKSFIPLEDEYPNKEKDIIMFKNIVKIAKELGMHTIAEGVETLAQFEYLKSVECDMVQGYLFDKPLPENEFMERIKKVRYTLA